MMTAPDADRRDGDVIGLAEGKPTRDAKKESPDVPGLNLHTGSALFRHIDLEVARKRALRRYT